jgi:hypothetical protein
MATIPTGQDTKRDTTRGIAIYSLLAALVAVSYMKAVSLLAVQTPWVNVVMGKASANTVLALIIWVIITERIGKRRNWSTRRIWVMLMCGVAILMLVVQMTPIPA